MARARSRSWADRFDNGFDSGPDLRSRWGWLRLVRCRPERLDLTSLTGGEASKEQQDQNL